MCINCSAHFQNYHRTSASEKISKPSLCSTAGRSSRCRGELELTQSPVQSSTPKKTTFRKIFRSKSHIHLGQMRCTIFVVTDAPDVIQYGHSRLCQAWIIRHSVMFSGLKLATCQQQCSHDVNRVNITRLHILCVSALSTVAVVNDEYISSS